MSDVFMRASRAKLRFATNRGSITVEQAWDLPLQAANNISVDSVGRDVTRALRELQDDSFVGEGPNPAKTDLELQLDVITAIRDAKVKDQQTALKRAQTVETRRALETALAQKRTDKISEMSEDDIEAALAELDK